MIYPAFKIDESIQRAAARAMEKIAPALQGIDGTADYNQQKMLAAFIESGVSESHFTASTGYGYGDRGREVLDQVYAKALGAEDALVRYNFVSGTHALTVALFGVLRPGDTMLSVTGIPYDTLRGVIGLTGDGNGSLREFGIGYGQIDLLPDGTPDYEGIAARVNPAVKMVYIQRSRGYSLRPSLFVEDIERIAKIAKEKAPDCIVMVDNCYGEFVQRDEPTSRGADLMAGSLIKNPGGGVAPTGGYIAGRRDLVESCSYRLTTPGTGKEIGCTLGNNRALFMGAFHAPHVTGEALKTAAFTAALFSEFGYDVTPKPDEPRADIIQAVLLRREEALVAFCQGVQKGAPVDAFVTPEPWDMPGYDCKVIMAAGAFTLGASIELSADAPLREPYAAWMQGGLNFHSGRLGAMLAAQSMLERGIRGTAYDRQDGRSPAAGKRLRPGTFLYKLPGSNGGPEKQTIYPNKALYKTANIFLAREETLTLVTKARIRYNGAMKRCTAGGKDVYAQLLPDSDRRGRIPCTAGDQTSHQLGTGGIPGSRGGFQWGGGAPPAGGAAPPHCSDGCCDARHGRHRAHRGDSGAPPGNARDRAERLQRF